MTTPLPSTRPDDQHGATPVTRRDRGKSRKRAFLIGALLVAALLALLLLLSQCGGDDPQGGTDSAGSTGTSSSGESSDAASESSSSDASSSSAADGGDAAGAASAGAIIAGEQSVLELAAGGNAATALAALEGQATTGTGVRVLTVPADEGFWVGSSDTARVWVQLTGEAGESPYQVREGDTVDFEGTVVAHDEAFAGEAGVDEAEGAAQLTELASHLEVAKSAVKLSA